MRKSKLDYILIWNTISNKPFLIIHQAHTQRQDYSFHPLFPLLMVSNFPLSVLSNFASYCLFFHKHKPPLCASIFLEHLLIHTPTNSFPLFSSGCISFLVSQIKILFA